ncbi:hypothetical protein MARPO_0047s0048, partial [Marchantia polymorpha]
SIWIRHALSRTNLIAALQLVTLLNGTGWAMQGGRKDGTNSLGSRAEAELPSPEFDVSQLIDSFARMGLSAKQMVVLSGSHTVEWDFATNSFRASTTSTRPSPRVPRWTLHMPRSSRTFAPAHFQHLHRSVFEANYYKTTLQEHKGLLTSDQSLFDDSRTRAMVTSLLNKRRFQKEFGKAMRAMGAVGVKTVGQIRTNCRAVNAQ